MKERLRIWGVGFYRGLFCIDDCFIPDGCTREELIAMERIRWHDILWLLIPIAGVIVFVAVVHERAK